MTKDAGRKITTEDQQIRNTFRNKSFITVKKILQETGTPVCKRTFINRMVDAGIRPRRSARELDFSAAHTELRFHFAIGNLYRDWMNVVSTASVLLDIHKVVEFRNVLGLDVFP